MEQAKMEIGKFFKIAIVGALVCTISSGVDIYQIAKETDSLEGLVDWLFVLGGCIWGVRLIGAGKILCKAGHQETGVVSAGGAMIFWAISLIAYQIFADEENMDLKGVSFYVWTGITLLGPAIFYLALKQDENNEDRFLGWASKGMGIVIISELIFIGVLLLLLWTGSGGGVSYSRVGDYTLVYQSNYSMLGEWIGEHFKLVMIIIASICSLGYVLCLGCMANYSDFLNQLEWKDEEAGHLQTSQEVVESEN